MWSVEREKPATFNEPHVSRHLSLQSPRCSRVLVRVGERGTHPRGVAETRVAYERPNSSSRHTVNKLTVARLARSLKKVRGNGDDNSIPNQTIDSLPLDNCNNTLAKEHAWKEIQPLASGSLMVNVLDYRIH
jgi:hypothetical protein